MQLNGAQKFMKEDMISLDRLINEFVQGEKPQETIPEIKKIMESMHDSLLSINSAYERISEVTKAFNKAFIYKEESYSTQTILDIFKSYGYKGEE